MFSLSINGGLVGYFKEERGVRQGDLLSLYIFVLVMNVLSRLLDATVLHEAFSYHSNVRKSV